MTDISMGLERDYTETIQDTTPTKKEIITTNWDEIVCGILRRLPTGQEHEESLVPAPKQQTGQFEETEAEEHLDASVATSSIKLELRKPTISDAKSELIFIHKPDPQAQRILRIHFVNQILVDLNQIQRYCGKPTIAVHADSLLLTMRTMEEISPFDPFVEIVMALHDALVFQDNWNKYNLNQYKGAYRILKDFAKRSNISTDVVEKAIMELEKLGFNTTPFELDTNYEIINDSKK